MEYFFTAIIPHKNMRKVLLIIQVLQKNTCFLPWGLLCLIKHQHIFALFNSLRNTFLNGTSVF